MFDVVSHARGAGSCHVERPVVAGPDAELDDILVLLDGD